MGGLYQRCLRRQRWVQRTHNTAKSEGLMVPPDFIVSLCSKMKTACLHHPVAVAAAGGLEQGLGPFGVCALSAGGSRGEAKIQPPLPKTPRSLPHPPSPLPRTESLLTLFAELLFFFIVPRCAPRRFRGGGRRGAPAASLAAGNTRDETRAASAPRGSGPLSRYTEPGPVLGAIGSAAAAAASPPAATIPQLGGLRWLRRAPELHL